MSLKRNIIAGIALITGSMMDVIAADVEVVNQITNEHTTDDVAIVKSFLEKNQGYIDTVDQDGKTFLIRAIEKRKPEIAAFLIKNKANVNVVDKSGNTALIYAVCNGYTEVVDLILEHGCVTININNPVSGKTALIYAIQNGYNDIMESIIKKKPDVINVTYGNGTSALICAIIWGNTAAAKRLIEIDAALAKKMNTEKRTPLIFAVIYENLEIIKLLMKNNVDISAVDEHGDDALMRSAICGNIENTKLLVKKIKDDKLFNKLINRKGVNGNAPLKEALFYDNKEVAQFLKEQGAK